MLKVKLTQDVGDAAKGDVIHVDDESAKALIESKRATPAAK